jgi:putative ABC transport system permease protein
VDHKARKKLLVKGIVEAGDATDNMLIVSLTWRRLAASAG